MEIETTILNYRLLKERLIELDDTVEIYSLLGEQGDENLVKLGLAKEATTVLYINKSLEEIDDFLLTISKLSNRMKSTGSSPHCKM